MKSLVIAEKPSVARDIARVLHCQKKLPGAMEGQQYVVTWALGHLVTLADPEEYDKKYAQWNLETLPMLPQKMQLVVIKQTAKQFKDVAFSKRYRTNRYRNGRRSGRRAGGALDFGKGRLQKARETAVDFLCYRQSDSGRFCPFERWERV